MSPVTLETFLDGAWHRAATLEFPEASAGDQGRYFEFDYDYLERWLGSGRHDVSPSVALPLEFGPTSLRRWPSFLDDLRPMGSARRWWLNQLNLPDGPGSDLELLQRGTIAPVGNCRVAEAVPVKTEAPRRFTAQAVIEREQDFIAWAAEHGAQVGGATGAGGDSPKLLLRREADGEVWIDVWQDEPTSPATHVLVKFARSHGERDRLILRSEFVYYQALARLRHQDVLAALRPVVEPAEWPRLLLEYVQRDVLNLVFGNSDNHGRNTALLKSADRVWLAPVYDFAPMKMDLEGISRTTHWGVFERGGDVDWPGLLTSFGEDEAFVRAGLSELATRLTALPALLRELGLPRETMEFPALGLHRTEARLREWGLL